VSRRRNRNAFAVQVLYHLTLPAVALAGGFVGLHGRYLRASLVESLGAPYVTVARAKGLPERSVLFRDAMRNSLIAFVPAVLTTSARPSAPRSPSTGCSGSAASAGRSSGP
jgi:ABC-type dipeptide/oligopeptide/nickel transport system permease component